MRLYSFKKELLFSLEFPVLHMTAVFLVHKADDEDHIWSCEIHFGSTVEQDSKFFTFRVAEFHNIEIINLYEVLTFLWTLNCSSTTAVVKDTFFRKSRPEGPRQQNFFVWKTFSLSWDYFVNNRKSAGKFKNWIKIITSKIWIFAPKISILVSVFAKLRVF